MVMDIERTGNDEETEVVEEETTAAGPGTEVLDDIARLIESVARIGDYRRTQRKECYGLVGRLKLLLPLIEEVRNLNGAIVEAGVAGLRSLRKALVLSRRLLMTCNEGSKIYLALESEAVMVKFHAVYEGLIQALDALPFDELGLSDEVTEQMELMRVQFKRAKRRTDTQDIELAMDVMVVFSEQENRNSDRVIVEKLAKKLELHTPEDLKYESVALRKLVKENGGPSPESIQQFVSLLNKFKQIVGVEVVNDLEEPAAPSRTLTKLPSLVIPHDFLCPITLEIMRDPVIIASGQTYERESIQKWLDSNHLTCPKTRQTLAHLSLAPNFALKNLISQWCDKNNFQFPTSKVPESDTSGTETSITEQRDEIELLVRGLTHGQLEDQRKAVICIRMLSKENPENRVLIAKCGAIPPLVQLLSYPDSKIKEHAVTALLNLSIDDTNKRMIAKEGAIPAIIEVLQNGNTEARENSAAALFSLSMLDENKITVGLNDGIPPLVELLQNGTIRGKKDAATALFNLSLNQMNKARAIEAGIMPPLLQLLKQRNLGMIDEALSILYLLSSHPDGRREIGQLPFIETLVEFIRDGTPKNKEGATSVLLELGLSNSLFMQAALQFGVHEHLVEIRRSGTNRGQRKANALLQLMSKQQEHIL